MPLWGNSDSDESKPKWLTDEQKKDAEEVLNEKNKEFNGKIQTNISKLKNYCKAEEYHQKYIEKNR